jgi:outer membrane lipoprotein SlyB
VVNRHVRVATVVAVLSALALSGCGQGGATSDDLDASRDEVLDAARQVLPGVVDALGAQVQDAYGEFDMGGDGIVDRRRYTVTVIATGAQADTDDLVAALEDAGVTGVEVNPIGGAAGQRDGLDVAGSDPGGRDMSVSVSGPYLEVADGVPREAAREDVDLG